MEAEKTEFIQWDFPIFLLKYKKADSLPAFHSSNLKRIVIESNSLNSIINLSNQAYPCLNEYIVKCHRTLKLIPLLQAPQLRKLNFAQNFHSKKAQLVNTNLFKTYTDLKEATISGMEFVQSFRSDEPKQQMSQPKQIEQGKFIQLNESEEIAQKQKNPKNQLQKIINPKKYAQYLQNHLGVQTNQQPSYNLKVDFSLNRIPTLPEFGFKDIKQLICAGSSISSLAQFAKGSYPSLQIIDLQRNSLKVFPQLKVINIKNLNLSQNHIKSIDEFSVGEYPKLQTLNLNYNSINSLPKLNTISLKNIQIISNVIYYADGFFSATYPQIEQISFKNHNLKSIKQINCPKLRQLDLCNNNLISIPILNTPSLKVLILKQNKIQDTSALQKSDIKLESLSLQRNRIKLLSPFDTSRLKQLFLQQNLIENFEEIAKLSFPSLQKLLMGVFELSSWKDSGKPTIISKLQMPLIKYIKLSGKKTWFSEDFFHGVYEHLEGISFGQCQNLTKLPKIQAPNLQSIRINQTKIQDISSILTGQYPFLQNFELPENIKLIQDKNNNIEQIILDRKSEKIIFPLYIKANSSFNRLGFNTMLQTINIDLDIVANTEFIQFLNINNCMELNFKNCRNQTQLIRNLTKTCLYDFPKIRMIQINSQLDINLIQFNQASTLIERLYVQQDSNWRRSYRPQRKIRWKINGIPYSNGWKKDDISIEIKDFQKRLAGFNHKVIIQKLAKKKTAILKPAAFRQRYPYQQSQWISPRAIRWGWPHLPPQRYPFRNPDRVMQISRRFFAHLQCPLAYAYLGVPNYWELLEGIGQCGGQPSFLVRTIDHGFAYFVVSSGMIKINQERVQHYFERKDEQDISKSQICIDCLVEVGELLRQIFRIQGLPCPLNTREQNIRSYRQMANSSARPIQLRF